MLVKELIEKLQKLDPEMEAFLLNEGDSPFDYGYSIKRVYELRGVDSCDGVYLEEG